MPFGTSISAISPTAFPNNPFPIGEVAEIFLAANWKKKIDDCNAYNRGVDERARTAAAAKAAERKPKPERQLPTEQAARPEAKPKQQATKNNRIDVRA